MCLGIPGQIVEITDEENKLAIASVSGIKRQVNITCIIDDAHPLQDCIGDWVLIHVGFAMSRIDEAEADRTMELLTLMGDMQEEMELIRTSTSD